jgi:hypothetical protein
MSIFDLDPKKIEAAIEPEIDKSVSTLAAAITAAVPHLLDGLAGLEITISVTKKPAAPLTLAGTPDKPPPDPPVS